MQCPECGAYIGEEDQFCGECGYPLQPQTPQAEPAPPEVGKALPTEPPPQARPAPAVAAKPPLSQAAWGKRPLLWLSVGGMVVALMCACLAVLAIWIANVRTTPAAPTETGFVPGALLYEDNFEDPESGWDVSNDGDTQAIYFGGEYRLAVYTDNYVVWTTPEPAQDLADFVIEVEARQVEGPLDNNLGLLVRYQEDDDSFYWFQISSDGYFSVDLFEGGEWVSLVGWEASSSIEQGLNVTNRLRLVCRGNQFDFYVNDSPLTTLVDPTYTTGNIGLAAGTFDEPGVVVHFDNLKVYALED